MTEIKTIKENKMGVMPINKLLLTMALPLMVSMLIQALYNVVDSIFVSQINEDALTAVSLVFPIQQLIIAVAAGTAVGINALLSRSLGEKNFEKANTVGKHGIFLAIISAIAFLVIGFLLTEPIIDMQTTDPEIRVYAKEYMSICCIFSFGIFGQIMFERLLLSTGKTIYPMIIQIIGAVTNLILDPILIFGYFGLPEMGVAGAAAATVIGQILAFIVAIIFNTKKNKEISVKMRGFRPSGKTIKEIYKIAIPSIIMVSISSILVFAMNSILISFTTTAVAVFGVYFKLQSFAFMPVFGLNNGMVPIVAYNYGARNRKRMMKTIKLGLMYAMSIMGVCMVLMMVFAEDWLRMFNASEQMIEIGVPALRTISICFIMAGFNIITTSVFQAVGRAFVGMIVSLVRQMCVLIPVAYALAQTGILANVWYSFPIAEIVAVVICIIFFRNLYKKVIRPLEPLQN